MSQFKRKAKAGSALAVLLAMLNACRLPGQSPAQPLVLPVCARLTAQQGQSAGAPMLEDPETVRQDTTRIQSALSGCAPGTAVRLSGAGDHSLSASADHSLTAFVVAPLRLPSGVTLLLDPGVTVFASRDPRQYQPETPLAPVQPMIHVLAPLTPGGPPAAILGPGILDGRGSAPLLAPGLVAPEHWSDAPEAARPPLVQSDGPLLLSHIFLRDPAGPAVVQQAVAPLTAQAMHLLGSPSMPGQVGLRLRAGAALALSDSILSVSGPALDADTATRVLVENTLILNGNTGLPDLDSASPCLLSIAKDAAANPATQCIPASAPLLTGELAASSLDQPYTTQPPAGDLTVALVVQPTQPFAQPGDPAVTLLGDGASPGSELVASTRLHGGFAVIALPEARLPQRTLTATLPEQDLSIGTLWLESPARRRDVSAVSATLTTSATTLPYGTPLTAAVVLTPATATGTVTLLDGTATLAQLPILNGTASFTTSTLSLGLHTLSAQYPGDANNAPTQSAPLLLRVTPVQTILSLGPLPAQVTWGTTLNLVAAASPGAATGTITFQDRTTGAVLGQVPLLNGSATLAVSPLATGSHTLMASYAGDTNDLPAKSAAVTTEITPVPTSATLLASTASAPYGTPVILSATLTPAAAGSSLTLADSLNGSATLLPLSNGSGVWTSSSLLPGLHTFAVTFAGDANNQPATSSVVSVLISRRPTVTALSASPVTLTYGTILGLSAAVTPASASGALTIRDTAYGVLATVPLVAGSATVNLPNLSPGTHTLTAEYPGDTLNAASTSTALTITVAQQSTTVTLAASSGPPVAGAPFTLTATLSPAEATGSVQLFDGSTALSMTSVIAGQAMFQTSSLSVGSHVLMARYVGDALHAAGQSAPLTVQVKANPSVTTLTLSENPVPYGVVASANIAVTTSGASAPGGTITLLAQGPGGSVTLGTGILTAGPAIAGMGSAAYLSLPIRSSQLGMGTWTHLAAMYSGDTRTATSDSGATPLSLVVAATPTTVALSATAGQYPLGMSVPLTARVASLNGVPPGSISFLVDGTPVGTAPVDANGVASFSLTALPVGVHAVSASLAPAGTFAGSSAVPIAVTVLVPFTVRMDPAKISLKAASSGSVTLQITPLAGYTGGITSSSCASNIFYVSCALNAPANLAGVAVTAPLTVTVAANMLHAGQRSSAPPAAWLAALLPVTLLLGRRLRRSSARWNCLSMLLGACLGFVCLGLGSCAADGGTFGNIPAGPHTVTVTVTSQGFAASTSLDVEIQ